MNASEIHEIYKLSIPAIWLWIMVSCCANPTCALPLRYLRHGRLFQFEIRSSSLDVSAGASGVYAEKIARHLSHFWLCGRCCQSMTLSFDPARGVQVVPLRPRDQVRVIPIQPEHNRVAAIGA